jgi:hypothetical protein
MHLDKLLFPFGQEQWKLMSTLQRSIILTMKNEVNFLRQSYTTYKILLIACIATCTNSLNVAYPQVYRDRKEARCRVTVGKEIEKSDGSKVSFECQSQQDAVFNTLIFPML